MNTNKIITITRRNDPVQSSDGCSPSTDWSNNLYYIMYQIGKNNRDHTFINGKKKNSSLSGLNADVQLTMDSDLPKIEITNKAEYPVRNLLEKSINTLGKAVFGTGSIAGLTYTDIAEDALDIYGLFKSSGGTSGIYAPWSLNTPAYSKDSIKGIDISYDFKFSMGKYGLWDAKEEVVKPILNLFAPLMIRDMGDFFINPPFPGAVQMYLNILKSAGENVLDLIQGKKNSTSFGQSIQNSYKDFTYNIQFGNFMTFRNVIVTKGIVSFSKETDSNGYPILGDINLTFSGVQPISIASKNVETAIRFGGAGGLN